MGKRLYLDASALLKRYALETGTAVVNHLFQQVPQQDLLCLSVGALEVISVFVRKRNANLLPASLYQQAVADFRREVLDAADFLKVTVTDALVTTAVPLIEAYSINATDALVLRSALDLAMAARTQSADVILVTSDQRLGKAAQAEGLTTFDPETQSQADLTALLGP